MYDAQPGKQRSKSGDDANSLFKARNEENHPLLRVFLFGPFRVEWLTPSQDPHAWESRTSALSLFKLLLCAPGRQASKAQLAGILWPESAEEKARESLRSATKVLGKVLTTITGERLLDTTQRDLLKLADQSCIWVDIDGFDWWVMQAENAASHQESIGYWQQAQQLLQGGLLADDSLQKWVSCRWIKQRRQTLWMSRCRTIRTLADLYMRMGAFEQAEKVLEEHVAHFPTDQDALFLLLRLLVEQGCLSEALALYKRTKQVLAATGKQIADHIRIFLERSQKSSAFVAPPTHILLPNHAVGSSSLFPRFGHSSEQALLSSQLAKEKHNIYLEGWLRGVTHHISPISFTQTEKGEVTMAFDPAKRATIQKMLGAISAISMISTNTDLWERLTHAVTQPSALDNATHQRLESLIVQGWNLCNENELEIAEQLLGGVLTKLLTLAPREGKQAYTLSQALRLQSVLAHHRLQIPEKILLCAQSVEQARYAHDIDTLVTALIELADAYEFQQQLPICLQTLEEAISLCSQASPLIQSRAYSNYAIILARMGRKSEAHLFIERAQEVFPVSLPQDVSFTLADASIFTLSYHIGLVRLYSGHTNKVVPAFTYYQQYSHPSIPERLHLEIINGQCKAAVQENDAEQCADLLDKAIAGAIALKSKKRFDEAYSVFQNDIPQDWFALRSIKDVQEKYHLERRH